MAGYLILNNPVDVYNRQIIPPRQVIICEQLIYK